MCYAGTLLYLTSIACLSTILFNILLQKVIRNIETNLNGKISIAVTRYIAHADNVLIFGRFVRAIEEVVTHRSSTKHWISDKRK
jgi:hypothetical protein